MRTALTHCCLPLLAGALLLGLGGVVAAEDAEWRAFLELRKLELETAALERPFVVRELAAPFLSFIASAIAAALAAVIALGVNRRQRESSLDQATHAERLARYPEFVAAMGPLALFFPPPHRGRTRLTPEQCGEIGRKMSVWYFSVGGLLLSPEARSAYFRLARVLTAAARVRRLNVPTFPDDAHLIDDRKIGEYAKALGGKESLLAREDWLFGSVSRLRSEPERRFRDFVYLQQVSSELRTALTLDLRSRRRPGESGREGAVGLAPGRGA